MQKTTTFLNKTDLTTDKINSTKNSDPQPKESSLQNILNFAATYRVQSINKNQYVEMFLN